jgi:hypothetical protein
VPVVVGEGEPRAGMRPLAADDHPRARRPGREVKPIGELGDLAVGARLAVGVERRGPRGLR